MRSFKLNEISGVDVPAQEGAVTVIMKRHDPDKGIFKTEEFEKRIWLTTSVKGHAHLVDEQNYEGTFREGGDTSWTQAKGEDQGHSHPWVRDSDGSVTIGEADGHTHEVMETTKRAFSAKERERLAESGAALSDGSFPIVTKVDLRNAISAFGRAKNKAEVARHIKSRARALKATDLLPEDGKLADLLKSMTDETKPQTADEFGKVGNNEGDITMTDDEKKAAEELTVKNTELQKQLDNANAVNALTTVQKAHYDGLEGDAKGVFLGKSADERDNEIAAVAKSAEDDDPVVYKTTDGLELRKSMGEAFITIAKSNDQLRKDNVELRQEREQDTLEKRVEKDLAHIPGDMATRVAMLKAIDGIEDDTQREAALNALKAQNESLSKAFDTVGHGGSPAPGSSGDQLDQLAKKHKEANPELTPEQAYDAVLKTEQGAELYNKSMN